MDLKEELNFFAQLPEKKKIVRIERGVNDLIKVGKAQLSLLQQYERSPVQKEIGFAYFLKTVTSTWENIEFSKHLGKGKYRHLNFFPARLVCENVFRIEYYVDQKIKGQNEICFWEMARVMKRFYDEFGSKDFKVNYDAMVTKLGEKGVNYPEISSKEAYRDPFPPMSELISKSKLPNSKGLYVHYRYLCESHHGKLISLYISENSVAMYRQSLFYVFIFSRWLLLLVDKHIQNETKFIVTEAIDKANKKVFSL